MKDRDPSLDTLLFLDGESFMVDETLHYWVKFEVKKVSVSAERPHGLKYSLTLHDERGARILGFDNAHAVQEGSGPGARTRIEYDHRHGKEAVRFYYYQDAATLMADFWSEVEKILEEGGGSS